jgi:hypothetical protein
MKNLPIGIQTFENMRDKSANYVYVDKTNFVFDIAQNVGSYFLSRPRRFGKSLFLGTLKSLFQGKKELFEGLYIYDKWDWSKTYPVIHFSFDKMDNKHLERTILYRIDDYATDFEVKLSREGVRDRFEELIQKVYQKHGPVVFLVDEYDKPIIEFLEYEEDGTLSQAIANQKIMKQFYGVLKGSEELLRLTFITGISKFAKVSVFSDLNHLQDMSINDNFAAVVGYTQEEVETYFEDHIQRTQEKLNFTRENLLEQMKIWYNGFSWDGATSVYNSFGLLNFFSNRDFRNYWFATGTPTMLLYQMKVQNVYDVENTVIDIDELEICDVENLNLIPLLFQTGYLAIKEKNYAERTLLLDYPNKEVRESMYRFMINGIAPNPKRFHTIGTINDIKKALLINDLDSVKTTISSLLADLPSEVYDKQSEGLYHGLLHFIFSLLGVYIKSEVHSSKGRADSVVETATHVYIFEFKFNKSALAAMQQIKKNQYAEKYRNSGKIIVGIGANFKTDIKEIKGWKVETL